MVDKKELRAKFAIERASAVVHLGYMEDAIFLREFNKALGELEILKVHLTEAERLNVELDKAKLKEAEESDNG